MPPTALLALFLHILWQCCISQAVLPPPPDSITLVPTGARAILIQWDFNREWRDISGRGFTITIAPPSGTGNTVTVQLDEHARSHLEGGLVPFSYNSPSGIVYEVFIEARNSFGLSDRVSATVTIPRCAGVCNYRFFTTAATTGCGRPCVCSSAYSGPGCNVPLYAPIDVQASFVFMSDPGGSTAEVIVSWDHPTPVSLDYRVICRYTVSVFTIETSPRLLHTQNFSQSSDGLNNHTLRALEFRDTFMTWNYNVMVTTVTDVDSDVATAPPTFVATHVPGETVATASTTPSPRLLPAPEIHSAGTLGSTSLRVSWSPVADSSGYILYVSSNGGQNERRESVIGDSVTTYVVENLLPNTEYSVQVAAVGNSGVEGQRSTSFTIFTHEGSPGPPANVRAVEISGDLVNVTWEAPSAPNGVITGYKVTVISSGQNNSVTYDVITFFAILPRPPSPYSITVQAINGAGLGEPANATAMVVSSSSLAIIVPAAAAGGGAILIICVIILTLLICCSCCRRRRKGRSDTSVIAMQGRPKASLPRDVPSYRNPVWTPEEYVESVPTSGDYLPMDGGDKDGYLPMDGEDKGGYLPMDGSGGGKAAEDQYAEIPAQRGVKRQSTEPHLIQVTVKKEATPEDYSNEELYMEMEKIYFSDPGDGNALAAFEFNRTKLNFLEEIGHGQFGRVMKAEAKIMPGQATSIVAVKMLKDDADDKVRRDFLGEAQLLAKFGSHPNVMGLLKVVQQSKPLLVILSYMPHGDLRHYLKKCARDNDLKNAVGVAEQLDISEQIAAGMEFLAAKFFIHRDLAARNVLVGKNHSIKISDFGLSRALSKDDSYYKLSQTSKMPVKWMALESLLYQKFSTFSDVWSYGIVLWEVFSFGETPYKGIQAMDISSHLQKGKRLSCPQGCPQAVFQLMQECWKAVKEERPTFTQLKLQLKAQSIKLNRKSRQIPEAEPEEEYT